MPPSRGKVERWLDDLQHFTRAEKQLARQLLPFHLGEVDPPAAQQRHDQALVQKICAQLQALKSDPKLEKIRQEEEARVAAKRAFKRPKDPVDRLHWHFIRGFRDMPSTEGPWCSVAVAATDMGVYPSRVTDYHQNEKLVTNGKPQKLIRIAWASVRAWHLEQALKLLRKHGRALLAKQPAVQKKPLGRVTQQKALSAVEAMLRSGLKDLQQQEDELREQIAKG
jgi:hypothetical protein